MAQYRDRVVQLSLLFLVDIIVEKRFWGLEHYVTVKETLSLLEVSLASAM